MTLLPSTLHYSATTGHRRVKPTRTTVVAGHPFVAALVFRGSCPWLVGHMRELPRARVVVGSMEVEKRSGACSVSCSQYSASIEHTFTYD
jgi:hypothetical protein